MSLMFRLLGITTLVVFCTLFPGCVVPMHSTVAVPDDANDPRPRVDESDDDTVPEVKASVPSNLASFSDRESTGAFLKRKLVYEPLLVCGAIGALITGRGYWP
jgi:hypothetical protein